MKIIDTTANVLTKTASTTIRTTGDLMKAGVGAAGNAAGQAAGFAPLAAALAAQPAEPVLVP